MGSEFVDEGKRQVEAEEAAAQEAEANKKPTKAQRDKASAEIKARQRAAADRVEHARKEGEARAKAESGDTAPS